MGEERNDLDSSDKGAGSSPVVTSRGGCWGCLATMGGLAFGVFSVLSFLFLPFGANIVAVWGLIGVPAIAGFRARGNSGERSPSAFTVALLSLLGLAVGSLCAWAGWPDYPLVAPQPFWTTLILLPASVLPVCAVYSRTSRHEGHAFAVSALLVVLGVVGLSWAIDSRPAALCAPPFPVSHARGEHRDVMTGRFQDSWGGEAGASAAEFSAGCLHLVEAPPSHRPIFVAPRWWRTELPSRQWTRVDDSSCGRVDLFDDGWVQATACF